MADVTAVKCYYGRPSFLRTSWTGSNPTRRFLGCGRFGKDDACGFFTWYDPPMCDRSTVVIPGLLKKLRKLETEIESLKRKQKILWIVTVVSVIFCFGSRFG